MMYFLESIAPISDLDLEYSHRLDTDFISLRLVHKAPVDNDQHHSAPASFLAWIQNIHQRESAVGCKASNPSFSSIL